MCIFSFESFSKCDIEKVKNMYESLHKKGLRFGYDLEEDEYNRFYRCYKKRFQSLEVYSKYTCKELDLYSAKYCCLYEQATKYNSNNVCYILSLK